MRRCSFGASSNDWFSGTFLVPSACATNHKTMERVISLPEVQQHNKFDDAWIIIDGKVGEEKGTYFSNSWTGCLAVFASVVVEMFDVRTNVRASLFNLNLFKSF